MQKRIENIFFDFQIIEFELVALNTRFFEREYLSSGVNMLKKSLKNLYTTKTEFLERIFFQSDKKVWQNYYCADWGSLLDPLTCWLSISVLTRGFFGI